MSSSSSRRASARAKSCAVHRSCIHTPGTSAGSIGGGGSATASASAASSGGGGGGEGDGVRDDLREVVEHALVGAVGRRRGAGDQAEDAAQADARGVVYRQPAGAVAPLEAILVERVFEEVAHKARVARERGVVHRDRVEALRPRRAERAVAEHLDLAVHVVEPLQPSTTARCCSATCGGGGRGRRRGRRRRGEEVIGAASEDGSGAILLLPFSISSAVA